MGGSSSIQSDIKRALGGKGFLVGVLGMALVITLSGVEGFIKLVQEPQALTNGHHAQWIMDALSSDWVTLALPILCALPFTNSFVDDIKSGFIKQYLPRSGRTTYMKGKLIACGLSGGLALMLGTLLTYGLSMLIFTPMELALVEGETAQPYLAQLLSQAGMLFFSGVFWSLAGLTFSALTMNKYMAYASPFILYYVLIILHERYFPSLYVLYPKEWLFPSDAWVLGAWGVILLLAELTAIVCSVFAITAQRRLDHV
ncbi:MAG: hypothetical protein ACOYJC_02100 [Christensenellales bacterium]